MKLITSVLILIAAGPAAAGECMFLAHPQLVLGTQAATTASVALGDFDGDGDLDILTANGRHWPEENRLFFNGGSGTFPRAARFGDGATSYGFALGDFDGDGDLDAVEATTQAGAWLHRNRGDGSFESVDAGAGAPSSRAAASLDADGDGDLDVILSNRGKPATLLINDGKAGFTPRDIDTGSDGSVGVAVGDLNGDGAPDLIFAVRDGESAFALLNDGDGGFAKKIKFGVPDMDIRSVAIGDMDGDDRADIVLGAIEGPIRILFGDDSGGFSRRMEVGPQDSLSYAIALGDLDQDGDLDIAVARSGQQNIVLLNVGGSGNYRLEPLKELTASGAPSPDEPDFAEADTYGVALGDLDGDGFLDIVFANAGSISPYYLNRPPKD